jgi:hypothetical protein
MNRLDIKSLVIGLVLGFGVTLWVGAIDFRSATSGAQVPAVRIYYFDPDHQIKSVEGNLVKIAEEVVVLEEYIIPLDRVLRIDRKGGGNFF